MISSKSPKGSTPVTKLQTKMAITQIEQIRVRNNKLWVRLLRIAVESDPVRSREVINQISNNDREITKWLKRI